MKLFLTLGLVLFMILFDQNQAKSIKDQNTFSTAPVASDKKQKGICFLKSWLLSQFIT